MALLIDINAPGWMRDEVLADRLRADLPGVEILCGAQERPRPEVVMAVTSAGRVNFARHLPGLKLVQKLGAGVDGVLRHHDLPDGVAVARLASPDQAAEISEYALGAILCWQRDFLRHARERRWAPARPQAPAANPVAVLGLGRIGAVVAQDLMARGYPVRGWSRTRKDLPGIACFHGADGLAAALSGAAYVVAVLPSTHETRGMFGARGLALLDPGAVLINVGRGDLIEPVALVAALDAGAMRGAVLDVTPVEPWPDDDPLWSRDDVLITPHVSGWAVEGGMPVIAENYRRLLDGRPLLNLVDRAAGY
jgi:glyoxylate/hydroxypyruvate reductase A